MFNTATVLENRESRDTLSNDDRLRITKIIRRTHLTTAERVAAFDGEDIVPAVEVDWGASVGREAW